jgi:enolase-phosphatase E1
VNFRLADRGVRAILLDIEGTTTSIAFVYEVLFPFARVRLRRYLAGGSGESDRDAVREALTLLRAEWKTDAAGQRAVPAWNDDIPESASAYLEWLMDHDVKSPALKRLQGLIWEGGYRTGELKGQVFADVPPAFARWREAHVTLAIYSSGSVLAQRLLFGATAQGDLTAFITAFFDTGVGAKRWPDSYRRISSELSRAAHEVLFVSDTPAELDAARAAGCQVLLAERPGNKAVIYEEAETIRTFDQIG